MAAPEAVGSRPSDICLGGRRLLMWGALGSARCSAAVFDPSISMLSVCVVPVAVAIGVHAPVMVVPMARVAQANCCPGGQLGPRGSDTPMI